MLKNKMIGKKIRNIIILIMAIIIMIGAYKYIENSRAENIIEIKGLALDSYGYLVNEEVTLKAKQIEDNLYEIELPESINGKVINEIEKIDLGNLETTILNENETSTENSVETV